MSSYSTYSTTGGGQDNLFRREDKENIGNTSGDNNYILIVGNNNNNGNNYGLKNSNEEGGTKYKYVKILVNDPFNNRDIVLKVTKKQKGVYV